MATTSNHGTKAKALRKLGMNEAYQLAMYILDQYRSTVLSCRYAVPPHLAPAESRSQLEELFKVAVVDTIMKHPMLQVGMIDASSKTPSWIQLQTLDLTQHIKWLYLDGDADFEQTVQETFRFQLDDRFPDLSTYTKQPGWKITVIRQGDAPFMEVLLTWNHPQFDGAGAKVLHEDFIDMLNNVQNGALERTGLDGDILRLPEAPPFLPIPIEDVKGLPLDVKFFAKVLWEEFRPQFLNRDVSQAAWCPIRSSPYKTGYRTFFVDNASLLAILTLCRQNKTTITGLVNGLALIAFSLRLDSTVAPAFQSSTIMDHRRNMPPAPPGAPWAQSDRAVSNYVTQCLHRYETDLAARIRSKLPANSGEGIDLTADLQRELWAASAQNRQEIVRKIESGLRNDLLGVFKWVTNWQQTMGDMAKKTRQFTWLVTNVGVLDGKTSDDAQRWSIERAQFGLSAEIPAAAIEFAPISVAGRGMVVSANWADNAVDAKFGERIMADLERWLAQLASQS
ncbi:Alcohol acetyltransferase [Paraconiothyrium brasiliense]|uniref:Alcohol acetyltransferase n=1 Tax=Paraconiothyrium brasiliense TaxID=300254 RepID=A0ABR3RGA3_9PLEO